MIPTPQPDSRQRWRSHLASSAAGPPTVVGIAASFTVNPIEPYLGSALLDAGLVNPQLLIADYNQVHHVCLDPSGVFGTLPQCLLLLWRLEDIFEADVLSLLDGDATAANRLLAGVAELAALVAQCAESCHRPIVAGIPPFPRVLGTDPLDVGAMSTLSAMHADAVRHFEDALGTTGGVRLVDHRRLVDEVGAENAHDDRGMLLYRQPYRTALIDALGSLSAETVASFDAVPPKVIVLDLDNTLWGGVVGDDGADGIAIGDTYPGNAFAAFQRQLRRLSKRGILLAVCSKNDAANVDEVFATRREMVLSTHDIIAWRVNWEPKSVNIAAIADELNLGLDSFLFIDDSDFELAEVTAALPDVQILKTPDDPAELPQLLASAGWFRSLRTSAEDRRRTEMMVAERSRDVARSGISAEEFLDSLELQARFVRAGQAHVARVTQLVNKTNQFNLTTRRRTEAEVAELVASTENVVHTIEVADRFGSYGLVGVAISTHDQDGNWYVDTFLLSCRVLRRGVETAFLAAVVEDLRHGSMASVTGTFVPSAKNAQVSEFYLEHGFAPAGDGKFVLGVSDGVAVPSHIELVTDA